MLAVFLLCGDKGDCRCPFTSVCDSTSTSVNCTEIPSLLTLCETVPFQRVLVLLLTPLLLRGALAATLSISMRSYLGLLSAAWGGVRPNVKNHQIENNGSVDLLFFRSAVVGQPTTLLLAGRTTECDAAANRSNNNGNVSSR